MEKLKQQKYEVRPISQGGRRRRAGAGGRVPVAVLPASPSFPRRSTCSTTASATPRSCKCASSDSGVCRSFPVAPLTPPHRAVPRTASAPNVHRLRTPRHFCFLLCLSLLPFSCSLFIYPCLPLCVSFTPALARLPCYPLSVTHPSLPPSPSS